MTEEKEIATENNSEEVTENNADEPTDLEKSIIRQVEYYFGDMNLVKDKFLREQILLDEEKWLPLEILIKFNRLANLSTDFDVIANALNKSTTGLVEVSEDNKKVRRSPEMPLPEMNEERRKELRDRTVYAKGFPKDAALDEILTFFKEQGDVENVIMRRYVDKATKKRLFKGSVFATFKDKTQADKFLETKGLKYGETELITLTQEVYVQKKQDEYAERKEKKSKEKENNVKEQKDQIKLPTGTVLHFSEGNDTMKREDIKDALTAIGGEVAYIDFKVGDTEGWVRLTKENSAKELYEKITDGKLKISEKDVLFKLLEGEEEKAYLNKTVEEMCKRRKNQRNFSKQKGRNFKGQGRKRKQDDDNGPPNKVQAGS